MIISTRMIRLWQLLSYFVLQIIAVATTTYSQSVESQAVFDRLVEWTRKQKGGYVDDRLAVVEHSGLQGIGPKPNSTIIPAGTVILKIPGPLILEGENDCETVALFEHLLLHGHQDPKTVEFHEFVKMVAAQIDPTRFTCFWSPEARQELQGLPPYRKDAYRHVGWYHNVCLDPKLPQNDPSRWSTARIQALLMVVAYSSSAGLPPIYHLMNHHRGLINTKIHVTKDALEVHTSRPVSDTEQLFMNYVRPSSAEIFRDYGFLESFPRKWSWKEAQPTVWEILSHLWTTGSFLSISSESNTIHTMEIWPEDGVVSIEPPTPQGRVFSGSEKVVSVQEAQQNALHHTASLSTPQLQRFRQGATRLLYTTLPTTWQQDEEQLQQQSNIAPDVRMAVEYRMAFKRDVETALQAAEALLQDRGKDSAESAEL